MAYKILDRIRAGVATAPGTGDIYLGTPIAGFRGFSGFGDGDTLPYTMEDGVNWELGVGTYHAATNVLSRTTVRASSGAGGVGLISATNQAVVYCAIHAEDLKGALVRLENLADANMTPGAANDGYVVYWDNTVQQFGLKALPTYTVPRLQDLLDVSFPSPMPTGLGNNYTIIWNSLDQKFELLAVSSFIASTTYTTQSGHK